MGLEGFGYSETFAGRATSRRLHAGCVTVSSEFFDLRATHNPHRWFLPVTNEVVIGHRVQPFLFGGVGMAAAVRAMERTCERPAIWATAQYLSFARLGEVVDLDVWVPSAGRHTSQARVIGHVLDHEILTVNAALGERPGEIAGQWLQAPTVPPPEDCEVVDDGPGEVGGVRQRLEVRRAAGRYRSEQISGRGAGRLVLWFRTKDGHPIDAAVLAIAADYVSVAISDAIGEPAGATSLDNTIRFAHIVETEWLLAEIQIEAVHKGLAHGSMRLFAQDGALMALASQSMILRLWREPKR
jgi:acyl-CoA thioesterase